MTPEEGRKNSPEISVLIPFGDPRAAIENVRGWTEGQTLDPGRYEVIAILSKGDNPDELKSVLRAHDQLLFSENPDSFAKYHVAAEATCAGLLFFTEDHCVPSANCLEEVLEAFQQGDLPAATIKWGHISRNRIAKLEEGTSAFDVQSWNAPEHWNRVRIRSFVIRASFYQSLGGLQWQHAKVSEALLAAKLEYVGEKIPLLEVAGIFHINSESYRDLYDNVVCYAIAESRMRDVTPPGWWSPYFRGSLSRDGDPDRDRWMRVAWKQGRKLSSLWGTSASRRYASKLGRQAVLGSPGIRYLLAQLRVIRWRLGVISSVPGSDRQLRCFMNLWSALAALGRASYARSAEYRYPEERGVHQVESVDGVSFSWLEPVSVIPLEIPEGEYQVVIDTGGILGNCGERPIKCFWNRQRLDSVHWDQALVSLTLKSDGEAGEFTIVSEPLEVGLNETRFLSLPVVSIIFDKSDRSGSTIWKPGAGCSSNN